MEKKLLANLIKDINKVVNSTSSRISKKDVEILVKVREGLKNAKSQKDFSKYFKMLIKLIGIGSNLIDKFK